VSIQIDEKEAQPLNRGTMKATRWASFKASLEKMRKAYAGIVIV